MMLAITHVVFVHDDETCREVLGVVVVVVVLLFQFVSLSCPTSSVGAVVLNVIATKEQGFDG